MQLCHIFWEAKLEEERAGSSQNMQCVIPIYDYTTRGIPSKLITCPTLLCKAIHMSSIALAAQKWIKSAKQLR